MDIFTAPRNTKQTENIDILTEKLQGEIVKECFPKPKMLKEGMIWQKHWARLIYFKLMKKVLTLTTQFEAASCYGINHKGLWEVLPGCHYLGGKQQRWIVFHFIYSLPKLFLWHTKDCSDPPDWSFYAVLWFYLQGYQCCKYTNCCWQVVGLDTIIDYVQEAVTFGLNCAGDWANVLGPMILQQDHGLDHGLE